MFSGKTSRLIQIYNECLSQKDIKVVAVNHSFDKRYDDSKMSTHDQIMIPCLQTERIHDIMDKLSMFQVILINEGQFFQDLFSSVVSLLKQNKQVYIGGLDGDFERHKFGEMLDLIPLCDKVTKLTSLCSQCNDGTRAIFSMRLTAEKQQTLVGSSNYVPVCRKCYIEP